MRKFITLTLKEVRLTLRDVGALVTMLATPLGLTLAMATAFGMGSSSTLADIPVLLLNQDEGKFSDFLTEVFESAEVSDLLAVENVSDEAAARARVESAAVAALVIVPPDFSERTLPLLAAAESELGLDLTTLSPAEIEELSPETQQQLAQLYQQSLASGDDPVSIEIYGSQDWQISTTVLKGIVTQAVERLNITIQGTTQLLNRLFIQSGGESQALAAAAGGGLTTNVEDTELPVRLNVVSPSGRPFNWLDYISSNMAVLFLMFSVTSGGRTLLAERAAGTLPRLLISPTPALTILWGKMAGVALTAMLQMCLLWGATTLIGAYWGTPPGVLVAIVLLVLSATGVGALISAWAKTSGQAGALGTAITLTAAAISGSFFPRMGIPAWLRSVSLILPNAWGIEIFSALQSGQGLVDILPLLGGVLLLTLVYYAAALPGFRRQFES